MSRKLAYLLAGCHSPRKGAAIRRGLHPRLDYTVFLERNPVRLLSFEDARHSRHPLVRFFLWRNLPYWGLSTMALAERSAYGGLLATGEDLGLPLALQAWMLGARIPIYITMHGSFLNSNRFRIAAAILHRMENVRYLCLAESLRRILIEEFGLPETRVHNTSWGVDSRFFRPLSAPNSAPLVVSAGTANRDYRTLIRAVAPLEVETKIAADSSWFPARLDIVNHDLPPKVEARSYRDYPSLRDLYARARFVVVPLYPARHACGYAVMAEAMAMGKAVIATRTESPSDFILDGESGYYVQPGDVDELRSRIGYLLEHPADADRMGQRGRARIEELFTLEAYCRRMEQVTDHRRH
jgi:glycosyltransferase involved in cell wall biosynthesis